MLLAIRGFEIIAFSLLRGFLHESWVVFGSTVMGLSLIRTIFRRNTIISTSMSALWGLLVGQILWEVLPEIMGTQTQSHLGLCIMVGGGIFFLLTLLRVPSKTVWGEQSDFEVNDLTYDDKSTDPRERVLALEKIRILKGYAPGWLYYQCKKRNLLEILEELKGSGVLSTPIRTETQSSSRSTQGQKSTSPRLNPFDVLGVSKDATSEEIRAAYRAMLALYHPDKVAHLGGELQKLAHERTILIQRAFEMLSEAA